MADDLATKIKAARLARGWTAQQLADRCQPLHPSLTRGTIAKIESRIRVSVTSGELAVLATVLEISADKLLGLEKFPNSLTAIPFNPRVEQLIPVLDRLSEADITLVEALVRRLSRDRADGQA